MAKNKGVKKKHTGLKIFLVCLLVVIAAGAGYYLYTANFYRTHFMAGTRINSIDVSDLTVDEAERLVKRKLEKYDLALTFRGGETEALNHEDIGYRYVSDGSIPQLLAAQNPLEWIMMYFDSGAELVTDEFTFDRSKLEATLNAFPEMQDANMTAPTDAKVVYEGNGFVVAPETYGTTINKQVVYDAAASAVESGASEIDVDSLENAYKAPAVLQDDEGLKAEADLLNRYSGASITYQLPGETIVLDGNTLKDWLVQDENGKYRKDQAVWDEHIEKFVGVLSEKINNVGGARKFQATDIGEITVEGGEYGYALNVAEETKQLAKELEESEVVEREPVYATREFSTENNGFGDSYIEIDLSRQHLWFYLNGELYRDTNVVSGEMTKKHYTPAGVFYLDAKERNRTLRGPKLANGQYEWESFVKYWMPFNGGIGLHDASWRGSFGGQIYVRYGSHGCVNMPRKITPDIYEKIDFDMPIIVYYSEPYKLRG